MRKIIGSVVLTVLLAWMALPLAAVSAKSPEHACCLKNGVHHCSATEAGGPEHGLVATCPYHATSVMFSAPHALGGFDRWEVAMLATAIAVPASTTSANVMVAATGGRAPPTCLS